jgi:hypothetical protein
MPKQKPPRFPVGLTVTEAVARGWRPGKGRPLIAGDDEIIREVTPDDVGWINPIDRPNRCIHSFDRPKRRRRRRSSSDSPRPMALVKAAMDRWERAQRAEREMRREHGRKWRKRRTTEKVLLALPAPINEALTSSAPLNAEIDTMSSTQPIVIEMEISPGILAMLCRRGFLKSGEISEDLIIIAICEMLIAAAKADIRAQPPSPPPSPEAPPPPPSAAVAPPAAPSPEPSPSVAGAEPPIDAAPPPPSARRILPNSAAPMSEEEVRLQWNARMFAVNSIDGRIG